MSYDNSSYFTKENLDAILRELGKQYRKLNGKKTHAEIILIGGAAVLANYGFRDMTTDVDAVIQASSSMRDAISYVGDEYNLPVGWLNSDFMYTASYSPRLSEFSEYYRTFSNILEIRTMRAEYLIAMKLMSGRKYKNDLSDVLGILAEHESKESPISLVQIQQAVMNLYGSWDKIPSESVMFIEEVFQKGNYKQLHDELITSEASTKNDLLYFEKDYPKVLNSDNIESIIQALKNKNYKKKSCKNKDELEL